MGRTLNWFDALLASARRQFESHQYGEVCRMLGRLAMPAGERFQDSEEILSLFVEASLKLGRFKDARRSARALIADNADVAKYHHLLARAIESDPQVDCRHAAKHYRRAIELDPRNIEYLCDAGEFAVSLGRDETGLAWLRRAHDLAPDSMPVLKKLVEGLCEAERLDEARELMRNVQFRHGRSPEYQEMRSSVEFRILNASQDNAVVEDEQRTVLPFVRIVAAEKRPARKWRADAAATSRPHFPRVLRRSQARHAP